jgi:hypothetical protein
MHLAQFGQLKKPIRGVFSKKWIIGADYLPSNAINQLEMWQAATFDSAINDKELSWAEDIGFNTMRVYLHSVALETG